MIRLIAAIDSQRGIAKNGGQPWFIPQDEWYFDEQTKKFGGRTLYGKQTFHLSLRGIPLAGRQNYMVTHDDTAPEGVELVHDLEAFLKDGEDIWVIGGAQVFEQCLSSGLADELYLTLIEANFACDQFFPEYEADFTRVHVSDQHCQNGFIFSYATYKRTES